MSSQTFTHMYVTDTKAYIITLVPKIDFHFMMLPVRTNHGGHEVIVSQHETSPREVVAAGSPRVAFTMH